MDLHKWTSAKSMSWQLHLHLHRSSLLILFPIMEMTAIIDAWHCRPHETDTECPYMGIPRYGHNSDDIKDLHIRT